MLRLHAIVMRCIQSCIVHNIGTYKLYISIYEHIMCIRAYVHVQAYCTCVCMSTHTQACMLAGTSCGMFEHTPAHAFIRLTLSDSLNYFIRLCAV